MGELLLFPSYVCKLGALPVGRANQLSYGRDTFDGKGKVSLCKGVKTDKEMHHLVSNDGGDFSRVEFLGLYAI